MKNLLKIILSLSFVLNLSNAFAATIEVTTFSDDLDQSPPCSLREAVMSANFDTSIGGCTAGSGDDTINLPAGTYTLTRSCDFINPSTAGVISISSDSNTECDDLDVYSNITVTGAGKDATSITVNSDIFSIPVNQGTSQDFNFRVFDVHTEEFVSDKTTAAGVVENGCDGTCTQGTTLSLKDLEISGVSDSNGGAVRVSTDAECQYSKLVTDNVRFLNNYASKNGGAVYVNGQYSANATIFDDNATDVNGGAVYLNWNKQCVVNNTILNSVFDSNYADEGLGGALFADTDVTVDIGNSTFQNNFAPVAGGAIAGIIGTMNITGSSIANNGTHNTEGGEYNTNAGGGIFVGDVSEFFDTKSLQAKNLEISGGDYEGQAGEMNLTIQGTQITNNAANYLGGGIATLDGTNGVADVSADSLNALGRRACEGLIKITTNLRDSTVHDNITSLSQGWITGSEAEAVIRPYMISLSLGGGIANNAYGFFSIENSTVDANEAMAGGGIYNASQMNIVKSTISDNEAVIGNFFYTDSAAVKANDFLPNITTFNFTGGGGLLNAGYANVANTTISGNKTDGSGAGVLNFTDEDYSTLYFIILSQTNGSGEGEELTPLEPIAAPGTNLNNNTIVFNEIVPLPEGETEPGSQAEEEEKPQTYYLNNGGGIASVVGKITMSNTVVARNLDEVELFNIGFGLPFGGLEVEPTPSVTPTPDSVSILGGDFAPDCYAIPADSMPCEDDGIYEGICEFFNTGIVTLEHNLIGNNLGCTPFQPAANSNNDIVGTPDAVVNPLIGALANNGGTTLSHLPLTGSPLIDNGSGAALQTVAVSGRGCEADDQRSIARPIDGNNDNIAVCDIGSLEVSVDCAGTVGGTLVKDGCGVCGGDGTSCINPPTPDTPLSCKTKTINNDQIVLDGSAHDLANLTNTLIRAIENGGGKKASKQKKISQEANGLLNLAWTNTWNIPSEIVTECSGTGIKCQTLSNSGLKNEYQGTVTKLYDLNKNLLNQLAKLKKVKAKNKKRLQDLNDKAYATALTTLGTIPDSTVSCAK